MSKIWTLEPRLFSRQRLPDIYDLSRRKSRGTEIRMPRLMLNRWHTLAYPWAVRFTHVTRYSREWHVHVWYSRSRSRTTRRRVSVSEGETTLIFTFIRSLRSRQSIPDCIVFTVSNRLWGLSVRRDRCLGSSTRYFDRRRNSPRMWDE